MIPSTLIRKPRTTKARTDMLGGRDVVGLRSGGWHFGRGNVSSPAHLNQKKLQPLITNTPGMTYWGSIILGMVFLALNPKLSTLNLKVASMLFSIPSCSLNP